MVVGDVKIWGQRVGAIFWDVQNQLGSFEYYPSFIKQSVDLAPLTMPIDENPQIYSFPKNRPDRDSEYDTFKGLPGLIADSLPDKYGNQLINVWLAQQGRPSDSMNPIEKLCFIGNRGMGALEFEPAFDKEINSTFELEIKSLVEITSQMLAKREQFHTDSSEDQLAAVTAILRLGTSAGGARAKALIAYNVATGEVKSGQGSVPKGYEHFLIKLDGVHDAQFGTSSGYGRVEMAYYYMAIDCGINMMPCYLLEENGRAHFLTQRFDRTERNTKHHIQTWCAMEHFDFTQVGAYSYEQLFQTMRMLRLPFPQAKQMFRRMIFNVVARNCDDHTKNFAFRLKQGKDWEITPAYDICYAYDPRSIWVSQHNISINGKLKDIQREDLIKVGKSINISRPELIIDEIVAIVKEWDKYSEKANVSKILHQKIKSSHLYI